MVVKPAGNCTVSRFSHPWKVYSLMVIMAGGSLMLPNWLQPLNAYRPMTDTDWGRVIAFKALQPEKAYSLTVVKLDVGSGTDSKAIQPLKAFFPITITLLGILRVVSDVQFSNKLSPIASNPAGKVIFVKEVQFLKPLYPNPLTPSGITNSVRLLHPSKLPIDVTEEGMESDCKAEQPVKAEDIMVIPSGSVMFFKAVQPLNIYHGNPFNPSANFT